MEDYVGKLIGRYKVIEILSESESTITYKAYDEKLDRQVIIKLFPHSREYSKTFSQTFLLNAKGLAKLSHKGIVKVLDYGNHDGYAFMVMEFVSTRSFQEILAKPMDWREAITWLLPIADALDYAHSNGIIHRDLKPENIIINAENEPVISDFSIVKIIENEETREVTGTHVGLGTPAYMSPEQGLGATIDYRADIYTMGILFYEMVTGQKPFAGENGMEVVIQQVTLAPTSPRKIVPDLPEEIERIILTALKKDPDERYQSMGELINDFQSAMDDGKRLKRKSSKTRGVVWVTAGFAGIVCLAAIGYYFYQNLNPIKIIPEPSPINLKTITPEKTANIHELPTAIPTGVNPTKADVAEPTKAIRSWPLYPVEGEIPAVNKKISIDSIDSISEIARLGTSHYTDIQWLPDDSAFLAGSNLGVYLLDKSDLSQKDFFDAKGWVTVLAVSRDGKLIATGDRAGIVRVWDFMTGLEKNVFKGHTGEITTLQFSEACDKVVSGSADQTIKIWALSQDKELFTLKKHAYAINAAVFTPDGKYVISGSDDFQILIWDVATGELIKQTASGHMIRDLVVSHDNKTIAVGLKNFSVEIRSLQNLDLKTIATLKDPLQVEAINTIAFSPTDYFLAVGSDDGWIRVWNISINQIDYRLPPSSTETKINTKTEGIKKVGFSTNGKQLISQTKSGKTQLWNYLEELNLKIVKNDAVEVEESNYISGNYDVIVNSSDGRFKVIGLKSTQIELWSDVDNFTSGLLLDDGHGAINSIAFSADNRLFAIANEDRKIRIWDPNNKEIVRVLDHQRASIRSISFSSDGLYLSINSDDGSTDVWGIIE